MSELTAAILVGGLGTRLRTVIPNRQKVVAPVAGQPFLFRLLDQVANAGVKRVVLCAGYKAEQVKRIGASYRGMTIRYSIESEPLGTAGALRFAELETPVLAMNGDSFCDVDLPALFAAGPITIAVREIADTAASGRVEFDADRVITRFAEKGQAGRGWINAGVYLLNRKFIESIPVGRAASIERETFPAWVGRGLRAFPTHGRFLDIGTPESYSAAQDFFQ
jgi:D-glycero-alpha-D-manno-heptose 1-phosphate guanylyltransferase